MTELAPHGGRSPRVLYVTAAFPFPLHSGYLRHHHLLRHLSQDHHLHLVSLAGPGFEDGHIAGVDHFVDRVDVVRRNANGRNHKLRRLLDPGRLDDTTRRLVDLVDREIRAGAVDVIVLTGKETAPVLDAAADRVPVVADLCDATSSRIGQEMVLAGSVRRMGLRVRRHRMRRIERQLIERAQALTIASERDRVSLHDEGAPERVRRAVVLPNGIDLRYWHRGTDHLGASVVFCGNLAYSPNADAARHLVLDVMPRVWAQRPDVEVRLVGVGASSELMKTLGGRRVTFTGAVDDVRPHLEDGAVFVAPLRIATGIQNKLLEAMAMEVPVVTTSVGAAGVAVDGAPPVTVADTVDQLAAAVLRATAAPSAVPHHAARRWVAERFDWTVSARAMADAIASARGRELSPC